MHNIVRTVVVVALELGLVAAAVAVISAFVSWLIGLIGRARPQQHRSTAATRALTTKARTLLFVAAVAASIGILAYNGWMVTRGVDPWSHTVGLLAAINADMSRTFALALAQIAAASVGFVILMRVVTRGLRGLEGSVNRWDQLKGNDRSVAVLFSGLRRALVITGWLLIAVFALQLLAPARAAAGLLLVVRIYLIVAVGLLTVKSSLVIVQTIDALSHRYAQSHGWLADYEHLRPLMPTFRVCLEYALWVGLASLAIFQIGPLSPFAAWGPKLIEAIALFFVGRVVIELGRLEIERRLLPAEGIDDTTRQRRATISPLLRSTFSYAVYFGTAVLILASLGFNPMPFLAGAGILGLVVGFGAQSLINDVVSGFFILFENTYLVGDLVEAAKSKGIVEAIEFRTTKLRGDDGRLHIIRNGDVKEVVNYSKDYALTIVPVDVGYEADLRQVFAILQEAGAQVRRDNPDILADMHVDGITAFAAAAMTVRTTTRVKPGSQDRTAAALRLSIKEAFDRRAADTLRTTLVPPRLVIAEPAGAHERWSANIER